MFGVNLSSFDRDIQVIFLRREGACGILSKCTRRTIGLVKVNEYFAVFVSIGVMITAGWVGRVAVRQIHELDEEAAINFFGDYQFMLLSPEFERDLSLHGLIQNGAQDIGHLYDPRGFITDKSCRDAELFFDGIPLSLGEETALCAPVIPYADSHSLRTADDNHPHVVIE